MVQLAREAKNNNTKKMNGKRYLIRFEMKKTMREKGVFVWNALFCTKPIIVQHIPGMGVSKK